MIKGLIKLPIIATVILALVALTAVPVMANSVHHRHHHRRHHQRHLCQHNPDRGKCGIHKPPKHPIPTGPGGVVPEPRCLEGWYLVGEYCVHIEPGAGSCLVKEGVDYIEVRSCPPENVGPIVCYDCGEPPYPPCQFEPGGCKEEPLEVKGLEVFRLIGEKVTPATWASAIVAWPEEDEFTVRFYAKYGSFDSAFYGGKGDPTKVSERYEPPCHKAMPADGFDEAWAVVYDRTNHTYAESEHVKFNIEEPENVHEVHPVG